MSNTISGTNATNSVILPRDDGPVNDVDQAGSPPPLGSLGGSSPSPDAPDSDLPPRSPTLPAPRPVREDSYDGAAVTLSQLRVSPVNVQAIAKLMIENDLEGRKATRMDRAANREVDAALQHAAADKMRDQASFAFAAAVTMSTIAIVGAGVSIGGSVKAGRVGLSDGPETTAAPRVKDTVDLPEVSTSKPAATEQPQEIKKGKYTFREEAPEPTRSSATDTETTPELTAAQKAMKNKLEQELETAESSANIMKTNNDAQNIQMRYSGYSSIITEVGKIGGAALNYEAAHADADKTDLQAEASKARTRGEDDTDFAKSYTENIQAVIEKLAAIQESENDSMRQIVRG